MVCSSRWSGSVTRPVWHRQSRVAVRIRPARATERLCAGQAMWVTTGGASVRGTAACSDHSQARSEVGPIMAAYAPSKTFLNGMTVQYARQLAGTGVLVNAMCPGLVATDFNGHAGSRTPEQGAATAIRLATLPDDGPSGSFFEDAGVVPW